MLNPIRPTVLAWLSVLLIFYGLVPILSPVPPSRWLYDAENPREALLQPGNPRIAPALVGIRNSTGVFAFAERKSQNYPLYYLLHVFPSVAWCIILPLQHVKSIRKNHRLLHKSLGFAAISITTVLGITGIMFPFWNLSYTHSDWWHLHSLQVGPADFKISLMFWPSFKTQTHIFGFLTLYVGYKNLQSGLNHNMPAHRRWSAVYTYVGYTIPMHRLYTLIYQVAGILVPFLPTVARNWLSFPVNEPDVYAAELAANAWAAIMGFATSAYWMTQNEAIFPGKKQKMR